MANLCLDLEHHAGLTAKEAANLLGYAIPTYYQYRRTGVLPEYARHHIQALMMMPEAALNKLIREHCSDDTL